MNTFSRSRTEAPSTTPVQSNFPLYVEGVSKTHGKGNAAVTALSGIDFAVRGGEFVAVMGPSGSGKSTLMHCASGLDTVDTGRVMLQGLDLAGLDDADLARARRTRIGFVFQSFNLLPALTVAQNVALPVRLAGRRPARRDVTAALDAVGLGDRRRHRPAELSGGQQQRAAIARALVTDPPLIVADEPTGALDTANAHAVLALLRDRTATAGRSVVMVTHDPVAATYADRVVFLRDGTLMGQIVRPTTDSVHAAMRELSEPALAGAAR